MSPHSQSFFGDSVTDGAGNAIASQRAVLAVRVIRQSVNHSVFERLILIRLQLPLAHHAVTSIAGVIKERFLRGTHRLFGFKLGVKD